MNPVSELGGLVRCNTLICTAPHIISPTEILLSLSKLQPFEFFQQKKLSATRFYITSTGLATRALQNHTEYVDQDDKFRRAGRPVALT